MNTNEQAYLQIREAARLNEDILGFVLTASRGMEQDNYPQTKLPLSSADLLECIMRILNDGNYPSSKNNSKKPKLCSLPKALASYLKCPGLKSHLAAKN